MKIVIGKVYIYKPNEKMRDGPGFFTMNDDAELDGEKIILKQEHPDNSEWYYGRFINSPNGITTGVFDIDCIELLGKPSFIVKDPINKPKGF